ncbi:head-tail joining protein [Methylobacterium sp. ID0610]|uniref:head-tail joining protein n=1 Tax=Methylobacterium carpenticola TaxID=3344827 RepID=UPI0036C9B3AA
MSAFDLGLDAMFEDPNVGQDAIWRAGGASTGLPVRIMRVSPEAIVGLGDNRFDLNAMLISVRLSEVPEPAKRDQVDLLDEDGNVAQTVEVTGLARIDIRQLVRTCEVSPLAPDDEDEP